MIKVWDLWVRLFHWSLVCTVGFQLISGQTGAGFFDWHRFAGEIVLALIVFRLLWGIVGSSNARLASFVSHPKHAIGHLRDLAKKSLHQERGHNAAGGWAVLAMLFLILVQAVTGMFISDDEEWVEGAFFGALPTDVSDTLYNIHHTNAVLLQVLVLVHITMIILYYVLGKQNLLKPMITGWMNWQSKQRAPDVQFGNFFIGLFIAVFSFAAVALLVGWIKLTAGS